MVVKTKAHYGISSPTTWVWGDKKLGASVVQVTDKSIHGKLSKGWRSYLWQRGKVVFLHRDFGTKAEAIQDAKSLRVVMGIKKPVAKVTAPRKRTTRARRSSFPTLL